MSVSYQREIADCCKKLKLSGGLAQRAMVTEGESNQEFLFRLLRDEIAYRQGQRVNKLVSAASFPKPYSFEQFHADEVEFPSGCTV